MRCCDTRVSAVGAALLVDGDATDGALFVLRGWRRQSAVCTCSTYSTYARGKP